MKPLDHYLHSPNISVAIEAIVGGANANLIGFIGLLEGSGQHQYPSNGAKRLQSRLKDAQPPVGCNPTINASPSCRSGC